jgi:hypothetical protein
LAKALCPWVDIKDDDPALSPDVGAWAGLGVGVPAILGDGKGLKPWDRLLRSLRGMTHAVLVLAQLTSTR